MKKFLTLLLAAALAASFAACQAKPSAGPSVEPSAASSGKPVVIGALPSIDVMPMVIADEQGFFKAHGITFKLELFKSSKDRDAAFQAGQLDGMCCDLMSLAIYQNAGIDLRATGMTEGEYLLVAGKSSGITDVAGLKGKSVAISEKTLIEYNLDRMLDVAGLKPEDVTKTAVPAVPTRLELLNGGKVDAAVLPEPYGTFAIADGGVKLSSATGIGLYPSIIGMEKKTIDTRHADLAAFYAAYAEGVDYLNAHPVSEYEDLVIKTVGYPENMKGKIVLPTFHQSRLPKDDELQAAIDWAAAKGLGPADLKPAALVDQIS